MDGVQTLELAEDQRDGALHLLIGILGNLAGRLADVAARQRHAQLAALGLGPPAREHALLDQVQLGLASIVPFKPSRSRSL